MKIDTSILRNELATCIELDVTTGDFSKGWRRCTEEVEKAIQRAESKTAEDQEVAEDRWYWKGRAHGLEYAIDALQTVFELISKGR